MYRDKNLSLKATKKGPPPGKKTNHHRSHVSAKAKDAYRAALLARVLFFFLIGLALVLALVGCDSSIRQEASIDRALSFGSGTYEVRGQFIGSHFDPQRRLLLHLYSVGGDTVLVVQGYHRYYSGVGVTCLTCY